MFATASMMRSIIDVNYSITRFKIVICTNVGFG